MDNGYKDQAVEKLNGHKPAGQLRGCKYNAFDAGMRVPFIVRWPGRVKIGISDALVSQIDFMASIATLIGQKLAFDDALDSFDVLGALIGETHVGRDHLVEQSGVISLIKGHWKYIEPGKGPKVSATTGIELSRDRQPQIYNLKNDLSEKQNVTAEHHELVKELSALLKKIRDAGRTRDVDARCSSLDCPGNASCLRE